jgi:hypothetical protein
MARYDFTNDSGMLKIVLQSVPATYEKEQSMSLATPSVTLANNAIKLYDSGKYKDTYAINDIGLIAGTPFIDIKIAFDSLSILISKVMRTQGSGTLVP